MKAVSLFSGCGGLDLGFIRAGFSVIWANEFVKSAVETYKANIGDHIRYGDIDQLKDDLYQSVPSVDVIFGGPPCQGFSTNGRMDPQDPRSKHVWTFLEIVEKVRPRAFVMENVRPLGVFKQWRHIKEGLIKGFQDVGYSTTAIVLNAADFGVPQNRKRVFFIGFRDGVVPDLPKVIESYKTEPCTVREALAPLDRAGTGNNKDIIRTKVLTIPDPKITSSPYTSSFLNSWRRVINLDGFCRTILAQGGSYVIDEDALYEGKTPWFVDYHKGLVEGIPAIPFMEVPKNVRVLTPQEIRLIQSFPLDYHFVGGKTEVKRQVGNAVPSKLAYAVASMVRDLITLLSNPL